jgi:hypothetical protein
VNPAIDIDPKVFRFGTFKFFFALVLVTAPLAGAPKDPPAPQKPLPTTSIQFLKEQKGGPYERFKIVLDEQGRGTFEATPSAGDLLTRSFEVSANTMQQLLAAFDAVKFLSSTEDYESHLKVADMGWKTIILAREGKSREVRFNYTTNKQVNALADFLSGLAVAVLRRDALEHSMKYDKLGLPDQLNALQAEMNSRWLTEPEMLLPVLQKISSNSTYFNIVQRKARALILQIESASRQSILK